MYTKITLQLHFHTQHEKYFLLQKLLLKISYQTLITLQHRETWFSL